MQSSINRTRSFRSAATEIMQAAKKPTNVGAMNGWWQAMFKVVLATHPVILAFIAWLSVETIRNSEFRNNYSSPQARVRELREDIMEELRPMKSESATLRVALAGLQADITYIRETLRRLEDISDSRTDARE